MFMIVYAYKCSIREKRLAWTVTTRSLENSAMWKRYRERVVDATSNARLTTLRNIARSISRYYRIFFFFFTYEKWEKKKRTRWKQFYVNEWSVSLTFQLYKNFEGIRVNNFYGTILSLLKMTTSPNGKRLLYTKSDYILLLICICSKFLFLEML